MNSELVINNNNLKEFSDMELYSIEGGYNIAEEVFKQLLGKAVETGVNAVVHVVSYAVGFTVGYYNGLLK